MKLLFTFIAILFLLFASCKRGNPCGPYEQKVFTFILADSNIVKFPYKGIDTLVFVNQDGDTAVLTNTIVEHEISEYHEQGNGNPECPQFALIKSEYIHTRFKGSNNSLNEIEVLLYNNESHDDLTRFIINSELNYQQYSENFFVNSLYTFPINFRGQNVLGFNVFEAKKPESKIVFYKDEGLIAVIFNDSNIYIKQ